MKFFSTILNSNHAGRKGVLQDWLKNHRFLLGIDKENIDIIINDDLTLTIQSKDRTQILYLYPDLSIRELPPYGIREIKNFNEVTFVNIKVNDINLLPQKYKFCNKVTFEYCEIPKEYEQKHNKIYFKQCHLV